jgi:hypothetical protein
MTLDEYKGLVSKRITEYKTDMRRLTHLRATRDFMLANWLLHSEEYMQALDDIREIEKKWPR